MSVDETTPPGTRTLTHASEGRDVSFIYGEM